MMDLNSLAQVPQQNITDPPNVSLSDLAATPPNATTIAAAMKAKRDINTRRRRIQADVRRQIGAGNIDLPGLIVQALYDKDIQPMRIVNVVSAIPRIRRSRAELIMEEAHIPLTRKLEWLARHPKTFTALTTVIQRHLEIVSPTPRQLPNPNWPWRD